jgi:hypothetical protein
MTMKLKDFERLKRLMMRTTSGTDQERLESIDHANKMLAAEGLTWEKVFARTVKVVQEVEEAPADDDPDERRRALGVQIDEAFEFLDSRGRSSKYTNSLREQWEARRFLSDGQRVKLFEIVDEARGRS